MGGGGLGFTFLEGLRKIVDICAKTGRTLCRV
jgi:hypothetical protein